MPFKWYMETVAFDVLKRFPVLPENKIWGQVRQVQGNMRSLKHAYASSLSQPLCVQVYKQEDRRVFVESARGRRKAWCKSMCQFRRNIINWSSKSSHFKILPSRLPPIIHASSSAWKWFRLNVKGELSQSEYCYKTTQGDDIIQNKCIVNDVWNPDGEWSFDQVKQFFQNSSKQHPTITIKAEFEKAYKS